MSMSPLPPPPAPEVIFGQNLRKLQRYNLSQNWTQAALRHRTPAFVTRRRPWKHTMPHPCTIHVFTCSRPPDAEGKAQTRTSTTTRQMWAKRPSQPAMLSSPSVAARVMPIGPSAGLSCLGTTFASDALGRRAKLRVARTAKSAKSARRRCEKAVSQAQAAVDAWASTQLRHSDRADVVRPDFAAPRGNQWQTHDTFRLEFAAASTVGMGSTRYVDARAGVVNTHLAA